MRRFVTASRQAKPTCVG